VFSAMEIGAGPEGQNRANVLAEKQVQRQSKRANLLVQAGNLLR